MNNRMLSGLALLCAALLTQSVNAGDCQRVRTCEPKHKHHYCHDKKHPFFVTVGSGASWSAGKKVHVDHVTAAADTTSFWDGAKEGYDRHHGTSEFYTVALGYHWCDFFSTNVELTHRPSYKYHKDQTVDFADNKIGLEALGNKTRYFDLKGTSLTFNIDLRSGGLFDWCSWECGDHFKFQLILGGGIGISYNRIENFHSVATTAGTVRQLAVAPFLTTPAATLANVAGGAAAFQAAAIAPNGGGTVGLNGNNLGGQIGVVQNSTDNAGAGATPATNIFRLGGNQANSNRVHSIMLDRTKTDFVWQIKVGFEVAYKRCSFDIFYRYHDAGKFRSHDYIVDAPVNFVDPAKVPAWRGDAAAHELCFNMNKRF